MWWRSHSFAPLFFSASFDPIMYPLLCCSVTLPLLLFVNFNTFVHFPCSSDPHTPMSAVRRSHYCVPSTVSGWRRDLFINQKLPTRKMGRRPDRRGSIATIRTPPYLTCPFQISLAPQVAFAVLFPHQIKAYSAVRERGSRRKKRKAKSVLLTQPISKRRDVPHTSICLPAPSLPQSHCIPRPPQS